jgi:membrane-associated phospholipid phosphatase
VKRVVVTFGVTLSVAALAASDAPLAPPAEAARTSSDAPLAQPAETAPGTPPAEPKLDKSSPVPWPAHGLPTVGVWDIVASSALAIAVASVEFGIPDPTVPRWSEKNAFDDWVRRWLRIHSEGGRKTAATTSDVLVYTLAALPFLNATLVAGIEHERWDVTWRLLALDAETMLTATLAALSIQHITARERPFVQYCASNPTVSDCSVGGKNSSFPSAHTTIVFAAVALECFHHGYLDTSHTGWGAAACPVTVVAASITGVLRIAADRHWSTDVIAGAVLGGTLGYAIPALHVAFADKSGRPTAVLTPAVSPSLLGITLAGRF